MVQRSLFIPYGGNIELYVHGQLLPPKHEIYSTLKIVKLTHQSLKQFVSNVLYCVSQVRLLEICVGAAKRKYMYFWKRESDCIIDQNSFRETKYEETCRSKLCSYLVPQVRKHCAECAKVVKRFASRKPPRTEDNIKTPNKFIPFRHLNTREKDARSKRLAKTIRVVVQRNKRLEEKLKLMVEEEGMDLDEELEDELTDVVGDLDLEVEDEENTVNFYKLFLEQQVKANKVKGKTGMRWHPLILRWAIQIKMLSSSAYDSLCQFIKLPSERTLFDYSHVYEEKPGIQHQFINEVSKKVWEQQNPYQEFHALLFDEVTVCQNLVQCKQTGQIVGYCHLTEVQTEILELKQKLTAEAQGTPLQTIKSPPIAKKILAYMIKGATSGVKSIVATYPVNSLVKEDLYDYTWDVVGNLEASGVKVLSFTCDGSEVNRAFFRMHPPMTKTKSGIVFDTCNIYDPKRPIFFVSDHCHVLKTARNNFENSGEKLPRHLWKNGEFMNWSVIVRLFKHKAEQTVKFLHKLTAAAVYLNSYSRMNVGLASRVMSNSVKKCLEILKWAGTGELCIFRGY